MTHRHEPIICQNHGAYHDRNGLLVVMRPGDVVPNDAQGWMVDCSFTTGDVSTMYFISEDASEAWREKMGAGPFAIGREVISDVVMDPQT